MKVIVDTSVWSLALRRDKQNVPASLEVQELQLLILDRRVQMIGPIRQELLSGIRSEAQFKKLRTRDTRIKHRFFDLRFSCQRQIFNIHDRPGLCTVFEAYTYCTPPG